jgi:hypothetical protein
MVDTKKAMTLREAGKFLDLTRQRVHQLIKNGAIKAEMFYGVLVIPVRELRTYQKLQKKK